MDSDLHRKPPGTVEHAAVPPRAQPAGIQKQFRGKRSDRQTRLSCSARLRTSATNSSKAVSAAAKLAGSAVQSSSGIVVDAEIDV